MSKFLERIMHYESITLTTRWDLTNCCERQPDEAVPMEVAWSQRERKEKTRATESRKVRKKMMARNMMARTRADILKLHIKRKQEGTK